MDTKRKTIFFVDDNATNLTAGRNTLSEYYSVLAFSSGKQLLKALEKTIPDLILLDVEMPEMTGYEAIKIIKDNRRTAHVPVIFLSAKSDGESELKGLTLGAVDYVFKPFSPPLLLKRIEVHLLVESQKQEVESQRRKLIDFNDNLQQMVDVKTKMVVELQNAVLKTMAELVECRDDITGAHVERTQGYLQILINALLERGMYKEETASWDVLLVLPSAQLHDVGKIAISDNILKKPGKLTDEEFAAIKIHPVFGKKIIERIEASTADKKFLKYAKVFAATHHEKWDGSGYPDGLKGEDIPLQGRMLAIVDVYDALVSERPYKRAFTHEEATKIIGEGSGKHFDPVLADLFISISDEFEKSTEFYRSEGQHNSFYSTIASLPRN